MAAYGVNNVQKNQWKRKKTLKGMLLDIRKIVGVRNGPDVKQSSSYTPKPIIVQ